MNLDTMEKHVGEIAAKGMYKQDAIAGVACSPPPVTKKKREAQVSHGFRLTAHTRVGNFGIQMDRQLVRH